MSYFTLPPMQLTFKLSFFFCQFCVRINQQCWSSSVVCWYSDWSSGHVEEGQRGCQGSYSLAGGGVSEGQSVSWSFQNSSFRLSDTQQWLGFHHLLLLLWHRKKCLPNSFQIWLVGPIVFHGKICQIPWASLQNSAAYHAKSSKFCGLSWPFICE